jgi:hypothetical protein
VSDHRLIREQNKENIYKVKYGNGQEEIVREQTASFPIKILVKF